MTGMSSLPVPGKVQSQTTEMPGINQYRPHHPFSSLGQTRAMDP